jgi:hypothetical protein
LGCPFCSSNAATQDVETEFTGGVMKLHDLELEESAINKKLGATMFRCRYARVATLCLTLPWELDEKDLDVFVDGLVLIMSTDVDQQFKSALSVPWGAASGDGDPMNASHYEVEQLPRAEDGSEVRMWLSACAFISLRPAFSNQHKISTKKVKPK